MWGLTDDMAIVSFSTDRKKEFEYATMSKNNNYNLYTSTQIMQ